MRKRMKSVLKMPVFLLFLLTLPSLSVLSLFHSPFNCHENELLICFPKEFLKPRKAWQPQYDGCCAVNKQFSWASLPFKGTFSLGPDHVKNVVVKGSSAFLLTQRCQMERVRISKHVNPHERKLNPFLRSAREFIQHVGNFLCLSNTSVPLSWDAICP